MASSTLGVQPADGPRSSLTPRTDDRPPLPAAQERCSIRFVVGIGGLAILAFLSAGRPSGADAPYGLGVTRTISVEGLGPQGSPFPCILATELKTHRRAYAGRL